MPTLETIATIARFSVGIVLVSAGLLKLADPRGWLRQAADMGVRRALAATVPWVEIVVGGALLSGRLRIWSAVAAAVLLLAFTALIVLRIADGSRPPCACFGSRSQRRLGVRDVLRNLALLGLAVVVAVNG